MSLSDVIRKITKTVTNKDELKEKAKDFPLMVIQSTLSAAGQALLLVDRVKNSIKGLGAKEEREEEQVSRPSAADQVAVPPAEDKPVRKEPVIFAPRPGAAEPNGVAKTKPEPVIFAPAGKEEAVATAEPEAPAAEPAAKTETVTEPETAPKPAAKTKATPKSAAKAETSPKPAAETEATPKPAAEAKVVDEPAPAAEPKAAPAAPKAVAEPAVEEPAAPKAVAEPAVAEAPVAAPEQVAKPAEPLPGYDEMTVASLRARMRGKTAEQISDFLAYEQATQGRPEVVRMFENRLAKLQAGE
ncbi:hypothetical protein [Nonomuraea turcica]|uniref:hypothetical protein n=1 Tax=Nonomuraea sp. G32 TaxID=3067274 RepID=UPI00273B3289|nr:hypothetical protein [Nonomuraea sp. G32]MDP4507348.1 hypothetical protein [Nonomuraea sp. G32]